MLVNTGYVSRIEKALINFKRKHKTTSQNIEIRVHKKISRLRDNKIKKI